MKSGDAEAVPSMRSGKRDQEQQIETDDGFTLSVTTPPMEAKSAGDLPREPKWDGFRCLAFKHGQKVDLRAKSGKPLGRYFPEVATFIGSLRANAFVVDGELLINLAGRSSFEAPEARLRGKLALATPARLTLFDMRRIPTVVTMTESIIVRLEKAAIVQVIHQEPAFSEMFIAHLLGRGIRVEADLVDQLFNSSEKRLARLLLLLANFGKETKPEPIIAKISQEMLAEMIGTTRSR